MTFWMPWGAAPKQETSSAQPIVICVSEVKTHNGERAKTCRCQIRPGHTCPNRFNHEQRPVPFSVRSVYGADYERYQHVRARAGL